MLTRKFLALASLCLALSSYAPELSLAGAPIDSPHLTGTPTFGAGAQANFRHALALDTTDSPSFTGLSIGGSMTVGGNISIGDSTGLDAYIDSTGRAMLSGADINGDTSIVGNLTVTGALQLDGGTITTDGSGDMSLRTIYAGYEADIGLVRLTDDGSGGLLLNSLPIYPAATATQGKQGTLGTVTMTPDATEQWSEAARPQQFRNTLRTLNIIYNPPASVSVTSITWSGNVATVTLSTAPSLPLVVGDTFALSGASPTDYNTGWQIASVTDTTHFTFSTTGSAIAAGATGTITVQQTAQLNLCAIGDSVAGKKPKYLFPEITRAIPLNSIQSATVDLSGAATQNTTDFQIEASGQSITISSGTGAVIYGTGGTNPTCDTVTVIYAKESGAGIFKLQTSTDVGTPVTWSDLSGYTAIDASNATLAAGVITLKFPYGSRGIKVMHVSGNPVRIVGVVFRAMSTSGWNRNDLAQGGIAQSQMSSEQSDFQTAEVAAVNPTLISSEWKDSYTTVPTYLGPLVDAFQAVKKADWIFNATTPVSPDAAYDANPTTSPTYLENLETQKVARARGMYYFGQGWWMWQTYAELLRLGLNGDGTHVNLIADYMMASIEAKELWFLCAPSGTRSADTQFVATKLTFGNIAAAPAMTWSMVPGTGDVKIARGLGNYSYFDDPSGNHMMILSSSSAAYANPSQLPSPAYFGPLGSGVMTQVDASSHTFLFRTSPGTGQTSNYYDTDAPIRALNVPSYFQQGGTQTLVCGTGMCAYNVTGNFTLPASPKQNGVYAISAGNAGWTLHQLAGQIIRCGSHATTLGTGGSITGTLSDSITLLYTGTAGGNQEWRVIASSDAGNLTWN